MKKYIITLCISLVSVCAFGQKGQKAAGLNLSYGTEISNLGIGAKGQYNFTDAIRGEVSFDYFLKKNYTSMWDININAHYLFPVAKGLKVYPLAGLTITSWKSNWITLDLDDVDDDTKEYLDKDELSASFSISRFGVNLGAGMQYDINDKWAVNFEVKYQLISDFSQAVFGVGVAYKF